MSGLIKKTKDAWASAKSIVSSIGPFLISQTENTSNAYARHQLKMANVEAAKTLLLEEAKSIASVRDSLRQKFVDADPEERIRIRRDLLDSESEIRQLHVAAGAMAYLPDFSSSTDQNAEGESEEESEPIPDHWMDRFNQYARQNNEPWRQDLLSRALAMQAASPDSVTPRALWTIGTLEKPKFDAFSAILDISSFTNNSFIIPGRPNSEKIPACDLGANVMLGAILFSLSDTGLMADDSSQMQVPAGGTFVIAYRESGYIIKPKNQMNVNGVMPSETGRSIARFYNTRNNDFGRVLLRKWIDTLKGDNFEINGPTQIKWG